MASTSGIQPPDNNWLSREYSDAQAQPLPTMLNVLTILTFVGSAFALVGLLFTFALAPIGYRNAVDAQSTLDQMPGTLRSMLGDTREAARLAYEYRTPIVLIGLLGLLLCFTGALRMRKRKKYGFYLYILGDLVPLVNLFFYTPSSLLTAIAYGFAYMIYLVFVILYATQLKYMQ